MNWKDKYIEWAKEKGYQYTIHFSDWGAYDEINIILPDFIEDVEIEISKLNYRFVGDSEYGFKLEPWEIDALKVINDQLRELSQPTPEPDQT